MEYVQSDHYDMNIEPEGSFDLRQKRWKWGDYQLLVTK